MMWEEREIYRVEFGATFSYKVYRNNQLMDQGGVHRQLHSGFVNRPWYHPLLQKPWTYDLAEATRNFDEIEPTLPEAFIERIRYDEKEPVVVIGAYYIELQKNKTNFGAPSPTHTVLRTAESPLKLTLEEIETEVAFGCLALPNWTTQAPPSARCYIPRYNEAVLPST